MPLLACNYFLPSSEVKKWNEIIRKQMHMGNGAQAILTYLKVQELGFHADNYTFPILLKAAGRICASKIGFALHGQTIKTGFCAHAFVQTALVNMYGNLHCIGDAFKVFEIMPVKDLIAWNSMLDAYASNAQMDYASNLFNSMPLKDISSFNIMISGYSTRGEAMLARSIFDSMEVRDFVSWNSMISAYIRAGDMEKGLALFREMPVKNTVTWNTMITGCLQSEHFGMVLDLFEEMKTANYIPDYLTVTSVLSTCGHLGSLGTGIKIHIYAIDNGLVSSPHVTTALIDMYSKCGSIEQGLHVFCKSQVKDIYCWNALISALALHGHGYAALKVFGKMRKNHIQPDDITFIGIINACSHSGLVQEGCQLFVSMQEDFGISPKLEHYGCMVNLLGRSGHLALALQVIETMPFEPGESILGALLSACIIYQDLETGERVIELVCSKAHYLSDGELMMFSNLYASCGNWEEANRWREMMNSTGIVKTAGYSVIEVSGRFQKFLAGEVGKSLT
ncbi:pentatricopeptide repeat-containing protein At2g45350, chloroplastic [Ricinus communis]|uniref:Pentatricopeptide repeat-containing protein, putative n=1 Tax=Ricinus communis TaxID=3988 RepID=B9RNU6_RICCO|nr:pentatricopeptide repeat-containing protein At2g45350, chloroplastic [Ricinus communis]EEF46864.1 pentatricopeptide repeat-containing protein, putative [Ricinus communis]|eukprot:XP_002515415.1 pentatricopeptide repeat-containing protein At2g45350, chloroplastic [Ricinus communis]